jgi:hypothetical protein
MNRHERWSLFLAVIQNADPCESSLSKKALKVGADLVRQIFRYFEFDLRVSGIHLSDAG